MMHRAPEQFKSQLNDEDIPKLCWYHVPEYLAKFELTVADVALPSKPPPIVYSPPARPSTATVKRRVGIPDGVRKLPQAIGEETYDLMNWVLDQNPPSFSSAETLLATRGIQLNYVVLNHGTEFTEEELTLLCACGALHEKIFRAQRRTFEFWNIIVPVLYAIKLGRIRNSIESKDISNNRYYDRWRRLKKGYDKYKQHMSGPSAPQTIQECRERMERLKTQIKGPGCQGVIPFVPIIMEAFGEFADPVVLPFGQGSSDYRDENHFVEPTNSPPPAADTAETEVNGAPHPNEPPSPAPGPWQNIPVDLLFKIFTSQQENLATSLLTQHGQSIQDMHALSDSIRWCGDALHRMSLVFECQLLHDLSGPEAALRHFRSNSNPSNEEPVASSQSSGRPNFTEPFTEHEQTELSDTDSQPLEQKRDQRGANARHRGFILDYRNLPGKRKRK